MLKNVTFAKSKSKVVQSELGLIFFSDKDFCSKCGKPILDFLKKYNLVREEK